MVRRQSGLQGCLPGSGAAEVQSEQAWAPSRQPAPVPKLPTPPRLPFPGGWSAGCPPPPPPLPSHLEGAGRCNPGPLPIASPEELHKKALAAMTPPPLRSPAAGSKAQLQAPQAQDHRLPSVHQPQAPQAPQALQALPPMPGSQQWFGDLGGLPAAAPVGICMQHGAEDTRGAGWMASGGGAGAGGAGAFATAARPPVGRGTSRSSVTVSSARSPSSRSASSLPSPLARGHLPPPRTRPAGLPRLDLGIVEEIRRLDAEAEEAMLDATAMAEEEEEEARLAGLAAGTTGTTGTTVGSSLESVQSSGALGMEALRRSPAVSGPSRPVQERGSAGVMPDQISRALGHESVQHPEAATNWDCSAGAWPHQTGPQLAGTSPVDSSCSEPVPAPLPHPGMELQMIRLYEEVRALQQRAAQLESENTHLLEHISVLGGLHDSSLGEWGSYPLDAGGEPGLYASGGQYAGGGHSYIGAGPGWWGAAPPSTIEEESPYGYAYGYAPQPWIDPRWLDCTWPPTLPAAPPPMMPARHMPQQAAPPPQCETPSLAPGVFGAPLVNISFGAQGETSQPMRVGGPPQVPAGHSAGNDRSFIQGAYCPPARYTLERSDLQAQSLSQLPSQGLLQAMPAMQATQNTQGVPQAIPWLALPGASSAERSGCCQQHRLRLLPPRRPQHLRPLWPQQLHPPERDLLQKRCRCSRVPLGARSER